MKRSFAALLLLSVATVVFANHELLSSADQLPVKIHQFIAKYFPNETISFVQYDKEIAGSEYEIRLHNGTKIDISKNGRWRKIQCYFNEVQRDILPKGLQTYLQENQKGHRITQLEYNPGNSEAYTIELKAGKVMKFSSKGRFLRYED